MKKNLLFLTCLVQIFCFSYGSLQAQVQTFTTQIAASADDVEEIASGHYMPNSSDIEFDKDLDEGTDNQEWVGLRFIGVTIPKSATISEAKIQFTSKSAPYNPETQCKMYFKIEDSDNSAEFPADEHPAPGLREVRGRIIVKDSVLWNVPQWITSDEADVDELSPDLKKLVQAVVNRAGWASGNAISFVLSGNGTGYRNTRSFDANPLQAAILTVKYTSTVGVNELKKTNIGIYPNPVEGDKVRVILDGFNLTGIIKLSIHDILGKEVYNENIDSNGNVEIPVGSFRSGIYFVKAQSANQIVSSKLVVK